MGAAHALGRPVCHSTGDPRLHSSHTLLLRALCLCQNLPSQLFCHRTNVALLIVQIVSRIAQVSFSGRVCRTRLDNFDGYYVTDAEVLGRSAAQSSKSVIASFANNPRTTSHTVNPPPAEGSQRGNFLPR